MKIKAGYNDKELQININGRPGHNAAELWLIQRGLPEEVDRYGETLSYITLDELLALKEEIQAAISTIFGMNS